MCKPTPERFNSATSSLSVAKGPGVLSLGSVKAVAKVLVRMLNLTSFSILCTQLYPWLSDLRDSLAAIWLAIGPRLRSLYVESHLVSFPYGIYRPGFWALSEVYLCLPGWVPAKSQDQYLHVYPFLNLLKPTLRSLSVATPVLVDISTVFAPELGSFPILRNLALQFDTLRLSDSSILARFIKNHAESLNALTLIQTLPEDDPALEASGPHSGMYGLSEVFRQVQTSKVQILGIKPHDGLHACPDLGVFADTVTSLTLAHPIRFREMEALVSSFSHRPPAQRLSYF
jgi:hypothetical protein